MLLDLIHELDKENYDYSLITLNRIDLIFTDFIAVITITDVYTVYICIDGEIVDTGAFNTPTSVISFIDWYSFDYVL